ncbi:CTIP endonuclease, partial [Polypterus senegalus]
MAAAELFGCRFQVYRNGQIFYTFRQPPMPLKHLRFTGSHLSGCTHSENPEVTTDVAETVGLCSFEGTESRSVVNLCRNDDLTLIQKYCVKQECDSKRPLSTDSVLLKEIGHRLTSTKNKDLLTQERISPVFGGPARAGKYLPVLGETESSSVLGQHVQNVSGYGRLRTKTEDTVSLAPLNVGGNSGQGTKYNGEKKKSEDDSLLSRNCKDLVNGEEDAFDKPLDLSDYLAGERPQENRENREWLKQATLLDVLKASVKVDSSAQKHCGVSDFSSKNSTENSHLEEAARRSHAHDGQDVNLKEKVNLPNFKKPKAPIKIDTEGDHVDIKQKSDEQEPKKKKVRTSKGDSEAASVLQLNPCLSARMILQQKQDDIGEKANDSLGDIFDQTIYGEYESCPQDRTSSVDSENDENCMQDEEDNKLDDKNGSEEERKQIGPKTCLKNNERNDEVLPFPHVKVVRNKEERRKMIGHTCKECEIYYADLPEEERQKKLSSCSRHRFRYIPPNTPENFWEVGFPSTQTCVNRDDIVMSTDSSFSAVIEFYKAFPHCNHKKDLQ